VTGRRTARVTAAASGVVVAALLWVLAVAGPAGGGDAASPLLGRPAPSIVSTTLGGDTFDLSRRKGSWVVLNFFNSTCVPCRLEHPELTAFAVAQSAEARPAELYTVINDDSDEAVERYFTEFGGSWPKVRDVDGSIAVAFGVARVPETWVIDPNGVVRLRITGALDEGLLDEQLAGLRESFGS
jgi:cytochrome c biogenesis protein CcmG/thiol:disulfide interchange protein DsbE